MDDPLVSIVTPSYQQGGYIEDTLLSVARQSYDAIEHIVVDGGSTDGTTDVLRRHEDEYALRWTSEPDEGQADAINKGFAAAEGEIVGWINSDDFYYDRDVVAAAVERFAPNPDLDVLYGDIAFVDDRSRITRFQPAPGFDADVLKGHDYVPQPGVFFDADVVDEHALRTDLVFCMDYEYWLRLADAGHSFAAADRVMAAYRMHEETKGRSMGLDRLHEEHGMLREQFGAPPTGRELLFKAKRNIRSLAYNVSRMSVRGQRPPVLREDGADESSPVREWREVTEYD